MTSALVFIVVAAAVLGASLTIPAAPVRTVAVMAGPHSHRHTAGAPGWFADLLPEPAEPDVLASAWSRARAALGAACGFAAVLGGPHLAVGLLTVVPVLVLVARPWSGRRRLRLREAALPVWLAHVAGALRSGEALGPALARSAGGAPPVLRAELGHMAAALRAGSPAVDALEQWARGNQGSDSIALAASALALAARTGGPIAQSVDRAAATLRERAAAQAEVRSMAAQARSSAAVLVLAPPAFTAVVATVDRNLAAFLFTTPVGWACLGGGALLDVAGAIWMARITERAAR